MVLNVSRHIVPSLSGAILGEWQKDSMHGSRLERCRWASAVESIAVGAGRLRLIVLKT